MPFDEGSLCRLFLNCACCNYEAYDMPSLPDGADSDIQRILTSLLEIDREKRATPVEFYQAVVKDSALVIKPLVAAPDSSEAPVKVTAAVDV